MRKLIRCPIAQAAKQMLRPTLTKLRSQNATVTIDVTQEDIDNGVRAMCDKCPIALAIARKIKCDIYVSTFLTRLYYEDLGLEFSNSTPMYTFVKNFDQGVPVQPFSFELDISYGVDAAW